MARENLAVATILFANRTYAIPKGEFANLGGGTFCPRATDMLEIGRPDPGWIALAKSMGIPAATVTALEAFNGASSLGFEMRSPFLIETML